jgi:CRISPR system Cascade subunit CasB
MHRKILSTLNNLSNGDRAELKRASLKDLPNIAAYFRVLKYSGHKDSKQVVRVVYLLINADISTDSPKSLIDAMHSAGIKDNHIQQICRSGDNSFEYLKRQVVRCKKVSADDIGSIAMYWGESTRRNLLKDFILFETETKI